MKVLMSLAACRTDVCNLIGNDGFAGVNVHLALDRVRSALFRSLRPSIGTFGSCLTAPGPCQAGLRTNIRLIFQAMVTRLHSPRTFSSPRNEN